MSDQVNHGYGSYGRLCSLFYDAVKQYAPAVEVDFYAQFMRPEGRVLEAMSGSGRLQIPLLQRGFVVDGVDNSEIMLERCRQRCAQLGLQPELYQQSLEDLKLPAFYQTITIAVGSFQLISNHQVALKVLQNLRVQMVLGGDLLIDFFEPDLQADLRSVREAALGDGRAIRLTTRYIIDEEQRLADAYCLYELMVGGVVQEQEEELIQVTWYTETEWREMLQEAGFELVQIYVKDFRRAALSYVLQARAV